MRKCTRCGGSGHFGKYCDNAVDPGFGESIDVENDGQQPDAAFENDGQQSSDSDDAPIDDPVDDPVDDPLDDPLDAPNDDPLDDPLDARNVDPLDAPNDDPVDVSFSDSYVNHAMISLVLIFHLS